MKLKLWPDPKEKEPINGKEYFYPAIARACNRYLLHIKKNPPRVRSIPEAEMKYLKIYYREIYARKNADGCCMWGQYPDSFGINSCKRGVE